MPNMRRGLERMVMITLMLMLIIMVGAAGAGPGCAGGLAGGGDDF